MGLGGGDDYVIGCSVCGTRAIEETCYAEHPEYTQSIDDPNSGAYARIIAYYEKPLEGFAQNSTELRSMLKSFNDNEAERQFEAVVESQEGSPVAKKIVYKEFSPPGKNPLTPLNHREKQVVKECFFSNSLAQKYVKEEERKIVATRRDEYQQKSNGTVKTFVRTDVGNCKSKMMSRTASEANEFLPLSGKTTLKPQLHPRGRPSLKKNSSSTQKFKYKISSGDDRDNDSNSSEMIIHFEMPKNSSKSSLRSGKGSNKGEKSLKSSNRNTPSNRSQNSGGSKKNLLQVPDAFSSRPRNTSPSRSKNPSRSASPQPPLLNIPKSKSNSRSPSPYLELPGQSSARCKSPSVGSNRELLTVPLKSPKSSRSSSPFSQSDVSGKSDRSDRSGSALTPRSGKAGKVKPWDKTSKGLPGNEKNKKNAEKQRKHVNVILKSKKKNGKLEKLPKLFEPRNLKEFFFVQKIAAVIIQRFWRKRRDERRKNSSSAQWEPKDFAGDCMFTSEELFKAMKLLGNFADFMERQGRKII
jgi:hypothetical protein